MSGLSSSSSNSEPTPRGGFTEWLSDTAGKVMPIAQPVNKPSRRPLVDPCEEEMNLYLQCVNGFKDQGIGLTHNDECGQEANRYKFCVARERDSNLKHSEKQAKEEERR